MNPETLAVELDREPLVPLRLHLSGGRTLDVRNPGPCYIARLALYLFRVDRPETSLADDVQVISLRHIASVETVEQSRPA